MFRVVHEIFIETFIKCSISMDRFLVVIQCNRASCCSTVVLFGLAAMSYALNTDLISITLTSCLLFSLVSA